ncbi:MAG: class I SAM-dependent methyltransferase [Bacteroidales bacterium]|jgi:ubiquinone/menaquinone biosynthesis C-methylase UbiE|nr:class I SAM-dependent methyltransferase [Bacteroidales bacterium]
MNEFDIKAAGWDQNKMHEERSAAIVSQLLRQIHLTGEMTALEFGAGSGITSLLLRHHLKEIVMVDSSPGMVKVMNEKVGASGTSNLKPVLFDLEKDEWTGANFNLVITQMVLHHVMNLDLILHKFFHILLPGGYLAIADLYPEDGSFHGEGFTGHRGFDTGELADRLRNNGFANVSAGKCFTIRKENSATGRSDYDVFLMIAYRP